MGIWKDKIRKDWCYKFKHLGKNYGGRGLKTRREAITAREKRREEVNNIRKNPITTAFSDIAKIYLDYSQRKHASATYKYKAYVYASFIKHHNDLDFDQITSREIHEYLNTLETNILYNAHRKDLSALFEYAIRVLKINIQNPCSDVAKMPTDQNIKKIPSEEEIIKMLLAAKPGDEQDILMCCLHTLGRIDEILRLRWHEDVNFEKKVITLWTRKRKDGKYEPDDLPMNNALCDILKARWEARKQDYWVFYNEDTKDRYYHRPKMMASICKRAEIKPIGKSRRKIGKGKKKGQYKETSLYYGFHTLRHFMASHFADQEKTSLKAISGLLRHKNLKTTEIYLHSIDESQRAAVEQISDKFTPKLIKAPPRGATKEKEVNV